MRQVAAIVENWQHQQRVGAVARVLQRLDVIPAELWDSLANGRPVALATPLDDDLAPDLVHPGGLLTGTFGSSGLDTMVQSEAEALLERPGAAVSRITAGELEVVIEAWDRHRDSSPLTTSSGRING